MSENDKNEFINNNIPEYKESLLDLFSTIDLAYADNKMKLCLNLGFIEVTEDLINHLQVNYHSQLSLVSSKISNKDLQLLFDKFSNCEKLEDLFIYNISVGNEDFIIACAQIFKKVKYLLLNKLIIDNNSLLQITNSSIILNKNLKELTLSNLPVDISAFEELSLYLSSSDCSINKLNITSCNLFIQEDDKENKFFNSLSINQSLESLVITNCNVKKEANFIIENISKNPSSKISILDLSQNLISTNDFSLFLPYLKNTHLNSLLLNGNAITDLALFYLNDYASEIINSQSETTKLFILELENNNITDKGAELIISLINNDLFFFNKLGLAYNQISENKIKQIAAALVNYSLRMETLMGMNFDKIFMYPNIGQISIDLIRNGTMNDDTYNEVYLTVINNEYNRYFRIANH